MKEQGNTQHSLWKILIALLLLAAGFFGYKHFFPARIVTVSFIYDNDETAPYSYNFYLAQETVQKTYQDKGRRRPQPDGSLPCGFLGSIRGRPGLYVPPPSRRNVQQRGRPHRGRR